MGVEPLDDGVTKLGQSIDEDISGISNVFDVLNVRRETGMVWEGKDQILDRGRWVGRQNLVKNCEVLERDQGGYS